MNALTAWHRVTFDQLTKRTNSKCPGETVTKQHFFPAEDMIQHGSWRIIFKAPAAERNWKIASTYIDGWNKKAMMTGHVWCNPHYSKVMWKCAGGLFCPHVYIYIYIWLWPGDWGWREPVEVSFCLEGSMDTEFFVPVFVQSPQQSWVLGLQGFEFNYGSMFRVIHREHPHWCCSSSPLSLLESEFRWQSI